MKIELSKNSKIEVIPFESFEELAKLTVPFIETGIVGLSGGSTYDKLFSIWSEQKATIHEATFLPVDERVVPISDSQSNWGNACKKFFTPLNAIDQCKNSATSVGEYNGLLHKIFNSKLPRFSAIFLGVGDDGHTASLFPNDPSVENMKEWVLATKSPKGVEDRITLSSRVISESEKIITILVGEGKEYLLESLVKKDLSKPFISVLSKKDISTLYVPTTFYKKLEELV